MNLHKIERQFHQACESAGLEVNGNQPHDPQILNPNKFYTAFAVNPYLAIGESFVAEHIDVGKLDFINTQGEPQSRYFMNITDIGIGGVAAKILSNSSRNFGPKITSAAPLPRLMFTPSTPAAAPSSYPPCATPACSSFFLTLPAPPAGKSWHRSTPSSTAPRADNSGSLVPARPKP